MGYGFCRALVVLVAYVVCIPIAGLAQQPEERGGCVRDSLPANIDAPRDLLSLIGHVQRRSATFSAQCLRIGKAANLRVTVQLDGNIRASCRAFTNILRRRGALRADVHVPPSSLLLAELLGHEFEHILEQLDAIDLRELARIHGSGVREVAREVFETDRAQRTGKIVAAEVLAKRSAPAGD